jgi:predicted ATP-grasp superfamily ATP-dependent carboligase
MEQRSTNVRVKTALHRNRLFVRSEKLRALLLRGEAKKILFSEKPDWEDEIKGGFRRLPHKVEFGGITEDGFQQYDIVVPLTLGAVEEARRCSSGQKKALPLPAPETVRLCDDKYLFNEALIKSGFGRCIPKMGHGRALTPPYILKKRIGSWGKDCYIIRNHEDEKEQVDRINSSEYFCQEIVPGPSEFATHILFVDSRIVKALNIKYQFDDDTPIKGQNAFIFKVVHRCPYLDLFERILRTIQFEGLCCVNYKVAKGQPFLLEINPRFGGSLAPYFFSFVRHLR